MAALGPAFERQNLSQKGQHKFSASSHTVEEIGPRLSGELAIAHKS